MRRVPPLAYSKEYYLTDCTGFQEFKKSWGNILEPRFLKIVPCLRFRPGMRVLDIGCGRGELSLYGAKKKALVIGIDYSPEAVKLAKLAKAKQPKAVQRRIKFKLMDVKDMDFPKSYFDMVLLIDVVEHLYPEEVDIVFRKISFSLKKRGMLVIHTAPNRWFYDYTYPFYCYPVSTTLIFLWRLITGKSYPNLQPPKQVRTKSHLVMHINEQTYFSLRRFFKRHNFSGKIWTTNVTVLKPHLSWKDVLYNIIVYLYPISNYWPFNIFFGNDFLCILWK